MAEREPRGPANADIARALREMALFLEMEGVAFKPQAYEKAAYVVAGHPRSIATLYAEGGEKALQAIPGIGKRIAEKIGELVRTGHIEALERYRRERPVDIEALTAVEGVGPKTVRALYDQLGVRDLEDLERVARAGLVRTLPHFGEKSEQRILKHLKLLAESRGRRPLGEVLPLVRALHARLCAHPAVQACDVAGSIRRHRETVGDVDIVAASTRPAEVIAAFVALPEVATVYARGETKTLVRLQNGLDADLRVVDPDSYGAALLYFTGSKRHGIALRRIAIERGLKLNEYGLFRGDERLAGRTEDEVYAALDLPYIPPELREDAGEIEAARAGRLPALVTPEDVRGDLQIQTEWTDGANSIEEMAEAARARGWEYIAITDHTRDLGMTGGSDEAKLLRQRDAIRALNQRFDGFRVLSGAEVNIRRDGTLDIADEALAQLDVVGAAVHSHFGLSREEMTRRVIRAMENPHVDILFHPTGRRLGKREPVDLDVPAVIAAAARTGTVLEIDAQPERLDLKDEYVRMAVEAGVPLVIDSDAHHVDDLRFVDELGVPLARRGWAKAADILNTLPVDELLRRLKDGRARRRH